MNSNLVLGLALGFAGCYFLVKKSRKCPACKQIGIDSASEDESLATSWGGATNLECEKAVNKVMAVIMGKNPGMTKEQYQIEKEKQLRDCIAQSGVTTGNI